MNATPEHQRILLEVADLDQRITRAAYTAAHPPQAARVAELTAVRQAQLRELTALAGVRDDAQSELARVESDVALAEQRRERDAQRLQAVTNPKDAIALEQEIASLGQRLSSLEDTQLDAMGALEEAEAALAAQQALIAETTAEGAELSGQAKAGIAEAAALGEQLARDRRAVSIGLPPELLADYERRAQRIVPAAALLRAGTCEGCRMVLSSTDLGAIRRQDAAAIVSCPECGAILVRTEESGL
ncbi:MAG: C4-type zinc ribbon domain-containing protein [Microbacterium sp.]